MLRDPLYRQIRRGLRELKDGNAFERCTNDLLRHIYPSLAPREGGDDAGLDGLIASESKHAIQLICTTGLDVLGNLSGSIESYLKKGGKSHACILATSQRLTNPKKRILEDRAKELGQPLMQIYDQAAMAQLLYRDSHWTKELLGLTGNPSPLSLFPVTHRPLSDVPPVGRDVDITKITKWAEDLVLVGQPGSGKTHLLFNVAKNAGGRFVVDDDPTNVANGVRSIQPRFLIVDDAHSRLDFLKRLVLLRQQIHADFRIVASCWPGQEDVVCAALQLSKDKCHELEGLPQKQIKEVIQSQKIFGPERLVAEIIHQSQGKPGLAVTLCRLCWESGNARDVVLGTALTRDVTLSFKPLLGDAAIHLLACFSFSGDAGMTLEAVAPLIGKNVFEVKHIVEQLAAAGILDVSSEHRISVHPLRLRQALVRDIFLKPPGVDLTPYLEAAPDFEATTRVLIEAKLMGGILSDDILRQRLQKLAQTDEEMTFEEYAHIGKRESEWVLENFPHKLNAVAAVALHTSPEKTLKMLLDAAVILRNESLLQGWSSQVDDILPDIKHWILSAKSNDDAFNRRELLATSLEKWHMTNKEINIGILATILVLSIKYEDTSTPPGEPMTMTVHRGMVAQDQLRRIASLWPKVLPILRAAEPFQQSDIANIFHEWIHPDFHGNTLKEYENESRGFAKQMMTDLLAAFSGNWTMHHHLYNYAEKLGLVASVIIDPIAETLYPPRDLLDWENEEKRHQAAAEELASQLSHKDPIQVTNMLITIEEQAGAASISYPSWGKHVSRRIAETTDRPVVWTKALFDRGAPADLVESFLENIAASDLSEAEHWISLALERPSLQVLAVSLVLKHYVPENQIWQKASALFKNCTCMIYQCILRRQIRNENMKPLLNHNEPAVSGCVAAGLCYVGDQIRIPDDLFDAWKHALVRHDDERHAHIFERVFLKYPNIAYEWIMWQLEGIRSGTHAFNFGLRYDRVLPAAICALTRQQRRELIDQLPRTSAVAEFVRSLVGRDMDLFLHLLSHEEMEEVRFAPLRMDVGSGLHAENIVHDFDEGWQKMAIAALDNGFSEEEILGAILGGDFSWPGARSSMLAARAAPFEKLMQHTDDRLRKIGKIGFEHLSELRNKHLAQEKRAAVRGEMS